MKNLSKLRLINLILINFICSSCASIINKKVQKVNIHSNYPYTIFQGTEKLNINLDTTQIEILRSKKKLKFDVLIQDSLHSVFIKPHISPLISLNLFPSVLGIFGFVVDAISYKSRDYPKNIYIYQSNNKAYYLPFKKEKLELKNNIKITPLRIFDFSGPTIELSYERKLNNRYSIQFLYGQIFNFDEKRDRLFYSSELKTTGNRKGLEIKYYLEKTAPIGTYISLDFNRLNSNSDRIMRFNKSLNDSLYSRDNNIYQDSILVNRKTNKLNLKFGYQMIQKNTTFDIFIGTGIKFRNVTHYNKLEPKDFLYVPRHGSFDTSINRPGKWATGNLALNFKIGLAF